MFIRKDRQRVTDRQRRTQRPIDKQSKRLRKKESARDRSKRRVKNPVNSFQKSLTA